MDVVARSPGIVYAAPVAGACAAYSSPNVQNSFRLSSRVSSVPRLRREGRGRGSLLAGIQGKQALPSQQPARDQDPPLETTKEDLKTRISQARASRSGKLLEGKQWVWSSNEEGICGGLSTEQDTSLPT